MLGLKLNHVSKRGHLQPFCHLAGKQAALLSAKYDIDMNITTFNQDQETLGDHIIHFLSFIRTLLLQCKTEILRKMLYHFDVNVFC